MVTKKNWKYNLKVCLIIGGAFLAVIIMVLIFTNATKDDAKENNENNNTTEYKQTSLPAYHTIDIQKTPLMYDFIYGTLNWHSNNIVPSLSTNTVFMFCKDTKENRFYVSYNRVYDAESDAWKPPVFGNAPIELEGLADNNAKKNEGMSKQLLTDELKKYGNTIKEGDFEFSWIWYDRFIGNTINNGTECFQSYNTWDNIDLRPFINNTKQSEIQKAIESGQGIDTQYLRDTETANIKAKGWDINASFWDNVNYGSYIKSKKVKEPEKQPKNGFNFKGDYVILTPEYKIMGQGKMVTYYFSVSGARGDVNAAEFLPDYGYQSVEEAINNPVYASANERQEKNEQLHD